MIGIFASSVGGLTVVRAIEQLCPGIPTVYLGDLARTPYGNKSAATILDYSRRGVKFLRDQGARLIIIACHSASSIAADTLRQELSTRIIDVIDPVVNRVVKLSDNGRIGVIGTQATIESGIYQERITSLRPGFSVYSQPCPLLVPLIEEGWLNRRETKMIVKKYLHPLKQQQIDTLVLGCSHYPLLNEVIHPRIGKKVALVDSALVTARHLDNLFRTTPELTTALYDPHRPSTFFVTDVTRQIQALASNICNRDLHLEFTNV
ncbi:MAG: glutamate racemase [Desulfobulbus propionicus]|nr:MAG: glutamate racemase [Desulfobulbus propionicus]